MDQPGSLPDAVDMLGILSGGSEVDASQMSQDLVNPSAALAVSDTFLVPESEPQPTDGSAPSVDYGRDRQDPRNSQLLGPSQSTDVVAATDLDAGTSQGQAAQPSSVADASPDADADDDAGAYPGSVAADADADATQPPSQWDSGDRGHPALDGSAAASDVQGGAAAAAAAVDGTDADADADAYGVGGSAVDGSEDIVGSAAGAGGGGGGGGGSMRFLDSQARDSFMRHLPLGSEPEGASLGLHAPWTESEAQEGAPGWGPEGFEGSEPLEDGSGLGAVGAGSEGPGAGTEGPVEGGTEGTEAAMSEDVVAGAGAAEALGSEAQPSALASGAGGGSAGPGATAGGSEPLTGAGLTHPPGTGVGSVPSGWGSYGGGAGGPGAGAGGSGGGGGGGGDDFGFEDDLEDYLAAQNQDPRQSYDDIMDYDDVMAELDEQPAGPGGGRSQSTVQQRSAAAAAATAGTNAAAAGPGPKRQRTEAGAAVPLRRGVPTMEELFGDDVEDVVGADVRPGAGQQGGRNQRPGGAPAAGQGQEEGEEGEEEAPAPLPARPYFPPQRMAANVTGGLAFPVTAVSGERVYCRLEDPPPSDAGISGAGAPAAAATAGSGRRRGGRSRDCLLDQPLPELLRILEERQLRAAVEVSELEELRRRQWADGGGAGGSGSGGGGMEGGEGEEGLTEEERAFAGMGPAGPAPWETPGGGAAAALAAEGRRRRRRSSAAGPGPDGSGSQLWVDKYAPRHFLSLLSDERTNREVALWVKDWDDTVFGRTVGAGGPTQGAKKPRPAGPRKDTRPANKVILIGGPPGLGKTTLAHVVARHCGYHPYEINASDDRTAAALSTKISDAVQMTAVLGGGRPNLVIVDEIDGATGGSETGGAVAALLKLVRAGEGAAGGTNAAKPSKGAQDADSDGEDEAGEDGAGKRGGGAGGRKGGKGRGSGSLRPLCRPIICICNDLYAPALRPLRDVARVFQFAPPPSERLGGRLGQICAAEGLAAEPAALRLLVERTDRDVRACLNTLQFLARRARRGAGGKRTIEAADIEALNIASKDTTQSAMDMWGLLLSTANTGASRLRNTNSAAGRKRPLGGPGGAGGAGGGGEVVEVCNRLQDFGDYDLVLNGLHENLPRVRFMDVNLGRTAAAAEAMALADQLLRHCRRSGDFGTLRYVPPCLAKVRSLAAQSDRPRGLTWPRLGAEAARRASAAAQLVRSWASGTAGGGSGPAAVAADPSVLAAHGASNMLLEVAPALRALVSAPQLRAVAPHMMSPEEQAALRRAAGLMLHYGLRYALEPHPPPGLAPLQLPEVAATNSNAIILGITTEVQQGIQAGAGGQGGAAGGRGPGGWQRGPGQAQGQQPWGANGWSGGRGGRGGPGGPGGRGPYTNAPGRGYGGGGGGPGRGYGGGAGGGAAPSPAAAAAAAAAVRPVPLSPPIDTLHVYTAFAGAAAAGARTTVPHVVRQMISQATETEAIRRQAEARAAQWGEPAAAPTAAPAAAPADAGPQPLRPMAPPQLRQMAGRMPPGAGGKKSAAAGPEAGAKRKGVTWMDAFKQQASAKARGGGAARPAAAAGAEGAAAAAGAEGGAAGAAAGGGAGAGQQGGKLSFTVLYRFNEGYTNAVKRPLLVRELM